MTDSAVTWRLRNNGAELQCGPLHGVVACDSIGFRLIFRSWEGTAAKGPLLFKSRRLEQSSDDHFVVQDSFVRGCDYVVNFRRTEPHRVTCQAYWRASFVEQLRAARVELILSAYTDLLDSVPQWTLRSNVPGATLLHASDLNHPRFEELESSPVHIDSSNGNEHLFVLRESFSYAQIIHPTDFVSADFDRRFGDLEATLFPEHLEKGVIRRGRICGWFMPAENDLEAAVRLAREFVNEPPPLTT